MKRFYVTSAKTRKCTPSFFKSCMYGIVIAPALFIGSCKPNYHGFTYRETKNMDPNLAVSISMDMETITRRESVKGSNPIAGSEDMRKIRAVPYSDRQHIVFDVMKDGSFKINIVVQEPDANIPKQIIKNPINKDEPILKRIAVTNTAMAFYDQNGALMQTVPVNLPKCTQLLETFKQSGCLQNQKNVVINFFKQLTTDASEYFIPCWQEQLKQNGATIAFNVDKTMRVMQTLKSKSILDEQSGKSSPLQKLSTSRPTSAIMNVMDSYAYNKGVVYRTLNRLVFGSAAYYSGYLNNKMISGNVAARYANDGMRVVRCQALNPQAQEMQKNSDTYMQQEAMSDDYKVVTMIDTTTKTLLGNYVLTPDEQVMVSSTRYKKNDDGSIHISETEFYDTDPVTNDKEIVTQQEIYDNVEVVNNINQ